MNNAEILASVTGATQVTHTVEKRNLDGTVTTISIEHSTNKGTGNDVQGV